MMVPIEKVWETMLHKNGKFFLSGKIASENKANWQYICPVLALTGHVLFI